VAKSLVRSLSTSADDDTTTRPPGDIVSTWVQLYCGDEAMGRATQIFAATRNVGHLADLVRAKVPLALRHCHAKDLVIYRAGTLLDALNADAALNSWDAVPDYTTGEQPLVVIAPAQAPQPESDGEFSSTYSSQLFYSNVLRVFVFVYSMLCSWYVVLRLRKFHVLICTPE
jgi:hypothetical protein